ncbi:MAG TPA: hypothetical protein VKA14_08870 [Gammaproteobacteria bacterium]|nr:hypothetical protein [Gammaproteobacteria bacterium]
MGGMTFAKVSLGLRARVPEEALERYLPFPLGFLGEELAAQAASHAADKATGYFPALEFLQAQGIVDKALYDAAEQAGWLATQLVRQEVQTRLRPVVTSLTFQSILCTAFTMPTVRPRELNALARLAEHYTPDTVKVELLMTLLQRGAPREGLERMSSQLVLRWLRGVFASVEVTASAFVGAGS